MRRRILAALSVVFVVLSFGWWVLLCVGSMAHVRAEVYIVIATGLSRVARWKATT